MSEYFETHGHKLCAIQLTDNGRIVCVVDDEYSMVYLISYYAVVSVYNMKLEKLYNTWPGKNHSECGPNCLSFDLLVKYVRLLIPIDDHA